MEESVLELLMKVLGKVESVSQTLKDMEKRLHAVESGLEFIRENFESNGKQISTIQGVLAEHAKEISDLGFEVRGTPTPKLVKAKGTV